MPEQSHAKVVSETYAGDNCVGRRFVLLFLEVKR